MNTNTQGSLESTAEKNRENSGEENKEVKATKSNSELMAEFFSVDLQTEKK